MSAEIQESRTVFSWDTSDAESGAVRMEKAFGRMEAAEKRTAESSARNQGAAKKPQTSAGGGKGHGGHGPGDFGMGVHDFLMGRQTAALFRFGNAAKLAGMYATGLGVALEAGGNAWAYARAEMEKTDQAAARLEQSFLKVSKAATFATVGEGAGKLAGTKDGLDDQIKGERAQQGDLQWWQKLEDNRRFWTPTGAGASVFKAYDQGRHWLTGAETTDQKMEASKSREAIAVQERAKVAGLYTGALTGERDSAKDRLHGETFDAQRRDSHLKEGAEIADAQSHGNGSEENLKLIREKYAVERAGIDKAGRAADQQLATEANLLQIRRNGGAVEVNTARERLVAAEKALSLEERGSRGYREKARARDAARDEVAVSGRNQGIERADARINLATAGFRGNDDERARVQAQAEVDKANEKVQALRDAVGVKATEEEMNQALIAQAQALTNQELQRRRQAVARMELESSVRLAPGGVRAAGARLAGASPEQAERAALVEQAAAAKVALESAQKRAAIEHNSVGSLQAQAAAAKELAQAQLGIALHDQQTRRDRRWEMEGARGETASLRLAASGRDDLADLAGQRSGSRVAIEHANAEGKPQLAAELAEQQRLRERKSVQDLYLNDDGTRRHPADVQRELFGRRQKQTRVDQFNRAMDRNGGLVSVQRDMGGRIESGVDPLTGQRLNARQINERNAAAQASVDSAKNKKDDAQTFADILKVLTERLPQPTRK